MRYVYTAAWRVVGGVNLPDGIEAAQLLDTEFCSVLLSKDPSNDLLLVEQFKGFANCWLERNFTGKVSEDWAAELATQTAKEAARRVEKTNGSPVLVVTTRGDVNVPDWDSVNIHVFAGMRYVHDAFDKGAVKQRHRRDIEAARVAVSLAGTAEAARFQFLVDGVCLLADDREPILSISLEMHAEVATSSPVTSELINYMTQSTEQLLDYDELAATRRLYMEMLDVEADRLRAFVSGWTALETLINKLFKRLEPWFYLPSLAGPHSGLRALFLTRVGDVMQDKYRIGDKLLVVTALLLPDLDATEAAGLSQLFKHVKTTRDKITHGEDFDVKSLPQADLAKLLQTYLRAAIKQKPLD